jgi:hypothetical protein
MLMQCCTCKESHAEPQTQPHSPGAPVEQNVQEHRRASQRAKICPQPTKAWVRSVVVAFWAKQRTQNMLPGSSDIYLLGRFGQKTDASSAHTKNLSAGKTQSSSNAMHAWQIRNRNCLLRGIPTLLND